MTLLTLSSLFSIQLIQVNEDKNLAWVRLWLRALTRTLVQGYETQTVNDVINDTLQDWFDHAKLTETLGGPSTI